MVNVEIIIQKLNTIVDGIVAVIIYAIARLNCIWTNSSIGVVAIRIVRGVSCPRADTCICCNSRPVSISVRVDVIIYERQSVINQIVAVVVN